MNTFHAAGKPYRFTILVFASLLVFGSYFAYDSVGQPWKTQATVRRIMTDLYHPTPGGEPGNDDVGAMSSWYVWSALGLYPEVPGTADLAIGSPLFTQALVAVGNGRTLTIKRATCIFVVIIYRYLSYTSGEGCCYFSGRVVIAK